MHRSVFGGYVTRRSRTLTWVAAVALAAAGLAAATSIPTTNSAFTDTTQADATFTMKSYEEIIATSLWHLDASDVSSMYQDKDCKVPVTDVGQPVGCWTDQRVEGLEATNTWANAPTLSVEPTMNGLNAVHFEVKNNVTAYLYGPDVFGGSTEAMTLFLVTKEHARTQNFIINLNGHSDTDRVSVHGPWTDGKIYTDLGAIVGGRAISTAPPTGTPMLLTAWKDPLRGRTGHHIHHLAPAYSTGNPTAKTTGGLEMGRSANHDVAEFIAFNRLLSEGEEEIVEAHLMDKWGVL